MVKEKRSKLNTMIAFTVSTIVIFIFLFVSNSKEVHYDDSTYKALSNIFVDKGIVNFRAFGLENNYIRGYFFPWLIAIFQGLGGWYVWWLFTAAMVSTMGIISIPGIIKSLFGVEMHYFKRIIICILFLIFYYGTIIYSLSDFWAVFFAINGLYLLVLNTENTRKLVICVRFLFTGILFYVTYNIRTIYMFAIIGVIFVLAYEFVKSRKILNGLMPMALLLVGILLAALPQMTVNYYQHNKITPQVITGEGGGLFTYQLYWGLEMQKYETYIGEGYTPALQYRDKVGSNILAENPNKEMSIANYFIMAAKHPLDFIGIYFRHMINMLDIRYPEIYIKQIEPKAIYPIINYSLIYLFLVTFINNILGCSDKIKDILYKSRYIIIILLPTIFIVPGAVETRFAIMLHLLIFSWVTAKIKWKDFTSLTMKKRVLLFIGYFCFLGFMCAIGGNTLVTLESVNVLY